MRNLRKLGSAFFFALMIAVAMTVSSVSLDAAGKKGGGKTDSTVCDYLKAIIDYEYTSAVVKTYALSLYEYYGCGE